MFHIVEFKVDNGHEVAIVPHNWLKDNCFVYWPPYKTSLRVNNAARKKEPPSSETWRLEKITRVLYSNEDFERVRSKLKRSEETSDLQTSDDEQKRKRKPSKRLYDSDSTSTDENEMDTESRQESIDQATTPKQARSIPVISPPPRLSTQALREASSEVRSESASTIQGPPSNTPSCGIQGPSDTPSGGIQGPPSNTPSCGIQGPPSDTPSGGIQGPSDTPSRGIQGPSDTPSRGIQGPSDTPSCGIQGPSDTPSRGQIIGPTAVTQILRVLETMREENREMKRMMQRLLSRSVADDQPLQLPEEISFPICSPEQMEAFDELLQGDQTKLLSVVRFLSMFGGADVRETVDRLMKEMISNELAKMFNMKGLKGKRKFGGLQILKVLFKCVQRNLPTKAATRKDVEIEVSKWLAGARDRDGGRKARSKVSETLPEGSD